MLQPSLSNSIFLPIRISVIYAIMPPNARQVLLNEPSKVSCLLGCGDDWREMSPTETSECIVAEEASVMRAPSSRAGNRHEEGALMRRVPS